MKHARKLLFEMPENEKRRVVDPTTHRIVDLRGCVPKLHDTLKHLEVNYRREVENQTNIYKKQKTALVITKGSRTEFFSKTYKAHITRKRKAIEIFYDLYAAIDLLDKNSSHEHHDIIVGKGDRGII
ncbi:MAG: hypothetical protein JRI87_11770 [Deltaproteobacteria bacterium]|nr:hypothetical protein [Deltaproteobacteria bacterium]